MRSAVTLYKWFLNFISNGTNLKSHISITKTKNIWHFPKQPQTAKYYFYWNVFF